MYLTDPIADMLTRVRNANAVMHEKVDIPHSKMKERIAEILKEQGYIFYITNIYYAIKKRILQVPKSFSRNFS